MKRAVDEDDIPSLTKIAELVNTISYKIKQIAKPVLMEVDGAVAGAAANMAVAADFCLATDKAKFIQAFVGVGLAPDAGGIHLMSRSIGVTRAAQLAMTGEALSAEKLWSGVLFIGSLKLINLKRRENSFLKIETRVQLIPMLPLRSWFGRVNLKTGRITLL